jgi:hypothetical protein
VDGCVAHCASLILGCLVMRRAIRTLRGERVALQAQQVDLADPKQARICGTMGHVTTAAPFRFDGHMLIHKWSSGICVALGADGVSAGQGFHLPQGRGAMHIMAVAAVQQALIYTMVIRLGKIGFGRCVAAVALFRLFLGQQVLRSFGVMRRMTVQTTNIIAGVGGVGEMPLFVLCAMATKAPSVAFLTRKSFEADDLSNVSSALHMRLSWAMA